MGISIYWIKENLGTAAKHEIDNIRKKEKDVEFLSVCDLIDGEGNEPLQLKEKVKEIAELHKKGRRVVVVCELGVSRSNAVALAYLVRAGMKFDKASNLIKKKVGIARIDPALIELIREEILEKSAEKDLEKVSC